MIKDVAVLVNPDMRVDQPEFAVLHQAVSVLEVGSARTNRLHFGSAKSDTGFKFIQQEIVIRGGTIDRGIAQAAGRRIAPGLLFLLRATCGLRRTGHDESRARVRISYANTRWNGKYTSCSDAIIATMQTVGIAAMTLLARGVGSLTFWAGGSLNFVPEPHF